MKVVANDGTGLWEVHDDAGFICAVESESTAELFAAAADMLDALRFVQKAIANFRDGLDFTDHHEHGALRLEEVKYCVVDPVIDWAGDE